MRVGFDCSPLVRPFPPGIVRITRRSLEALEAAGELEVVRLEPPAGVPFEPWRRKALPQAVREQGLAGVHSFLSSFPLKGLGKRVQTIHELPWKHGVTENAGWRHRLWPRLGSWKADGIVTASETVATELGMRRAPAGKLHVIPWGVDERFQEEPEPGTVDEMLLDRYRLPEGQLILAIGAVRAKKNLAALLHGLAALKDAPGQTPHLVVTGPDTPDLRRDLGLVSKLGLARHVSTPGEVEDADLPGLLRLAAVVPVLSRSEGFGLPVLEALGCGTPVVVPEGSAQAEIAGEQGFACDSADPGSVADALRRAMKAREELRYVLPDRAREFPWSRTAQGIAELWKSLA